MERRMKAKQSYHTRSKSLGEETVEDMSSNHLHRQATYDDYHTRKMEVDADQDVWMNSFSSWKMKRIQATSSERDRKAERDEVEENQEKLKRKKSKTFREIVEEKRRRDKFLQSGSLDVGSMDSGEIVQILADLPSTTIDSDNEQEIPKPELSERIKETKQKEMRPAGEPDRKKEIRQRSNTLPSNYPKPDVKGTKVPPPVKPKPRSRSGSLRNRSNSIGEKLYEPEVITATNSYTTYASLPPSMEREDPRPVVNHEVSRPAMNREEPRPAVNREESRPVIRHEEPRPPVKREEPKPAVDHGAPRQSSFHDRLMKARQLEQEADLNEQRAKEEARKPYKPRKSSIFDKIRSFDTGEAFKKIDDVDSSNRVVPGVETKGKPEENEDDYEDMVIIMSQQKMSQRGFGFQTSGGYDERKPLVVSRVNKGSVADFSDLRVGDQILSINKESTRRFNQEDVQQCLSQSILTGKLTCKVRRYVDGKEPPVNPAPVSEPVFRRNSAPKVESKPPPTPVQPRTQPVRQPVPVPQPVRTVSPEPTKVVEPPEEKDDLDENIDLLRPDPTRNALARARQMLDKLEMDEEESSSRSSDTADHSPVSSMGSSSYTSNKPLYSQPPKTNGYHVPHEDNSEYGEPVVSMEDEVDGAYVRESQDLKTDKDWFPNASMEVALGSQSSLQGSEDRFSSEGPQISPEKVDLSPGSVEVDQDLNESFTQSEDFDDNESGVVPLNTGSDEDDDNGNDDDNIESADRNSIDDESISSEDTRQPSLRSKQPNRPALQSQMRVNSPPSSLDLEVSLRNQEPQSQFKFKSFLAPKPYKSKDNDLSRRENTAPASDSDDLTKKRDDLQQRRSEFFSKIVYPPHVKLHWQHRTVDEDGSVRSAEEMDGTWREAEEPVVAQNEDVTEMMPVRRPIKPHTAHRKPFNREEERKRLEKWNEEQERRRREKYELDQQRLKEEQERALQMAVEDVQRKRDEEEKALEEKHRMMQKQQEEMREMRRKQMEEEENRRKAKLEQDRLAWEEAERQRQEEEKRIERERAEEQRQERERLEKERILREAAEKERQEREKERKEQKERERLQREREERERAAREKIKREQEEYARMLKEREQERQERERLKEEEEQRRQEEEDAERERLEVEKWKKESEERERAAKAKLEKDEEMRRKLEEEERARIREEEREKMRQEWEEERKRELEQLQQEKEKLRKEMEALAKKHEEERSMLRAERERLSKEKELEQRKAPQVIEEPVGRMTNGDVMSMPKKELELRHSPRNSHSPQTVSPGTQRIRENNQKNMVPERDHPQNHSIMSHYNDPNIPTSQHWLFEEAERRRRAEEQGFERNMPPDVVIPPQKDVGPPQKPPHSIPRQSNAYPRGFEPEHPTRIPPQRQEPSKEMPVINAPVMRRMRKPEAEMERQRKMQNRRSLPDLGGGRDNAVPSNGYREDPSAKTNARSFLSRALSTENVDNVSAFTRSYPGQPQYQRRPSYEVHLQYHRQPRGYRQPEYWGPPPESRQTQYHRHPMQSNRQSDVPSAVYAVSNSEMGPRVQMYASEPRSFTARTVTATKPVSNSRRYSSSSSEREFNFKPIQQESKPRKYSSTYYMDV